MYRNKESLNILKKLLSLLTEEENKILNTKDKNDDYSTNIEAIKSLKKELNEAINNIKSPNGKNHAIINGITIKTLDESDNKIASYLQDILNKVDYDDNSNFLNTKEESTPKIGDIITLSSDDNIYTTQTDSILETNNKPINNKDVLILGISIFYNDAIINIYANYPDYANTISNLLLDKGEIVSYIVGNIPSKDITTLKTEEIDSLIIGYYNGKNIELTKKRGK